MYFKNKLQRLSSSVYVIVGLALGATALLPMFMQTASAAQITSRSIQISSAVPSATASYLVQFTPTTTGAQSLVIDFCMNDPIISDTCTTTNDVVASSAGFTAGTGTSNWVIGSAGATTLKLNMGSGSALGTSQINFTLTNITNPSAAAGSFYARIYTYANNSYGTYSSATSPGNYVDYGGVALTTAQTISVTAKVQEEITFCVYTSSCGTGSSVTLGTNGVLSSSAYNVDTSTQYSIQTNAQHNAVVNVSGATLTSGANTIPGLTSPTAWASNTSEFGICTYASTGAGLFTATANYNGVGSACSGATTGAGSSSTIEYYYPAAAQSGTYGDTIATEQPGTGSTGVVPMMAAASTAQTAGVYTSTLDFIATGTY